MSNDEKAALTEQLDHINAELLIAWKRIEELDAERDRLERVIGEKDG